MSPRGHNFRLVLDKTPVDNTTQVTVQYDPAQRPQLRIEPPPGAGDWKSPDINMTGPAGRNVLAAGRNHTIDITVHNRGDWPANNVKIRVAWLPIPTAPGPWNQLPVQPAPQNIPAHGKVVYRASWDVPKMTLDGVDSFGGTDTSIWWASIARNQVSLSIAVFTEVAEAFPGRADQPLQPGHPQPRSHHQHPLQIGADLSGKQAPHRRRAGAPARSVGGHGDPGADGERHAERVRRERTDQRAGVRQRHHGGAPACPADHRRLLAVQGGVPYPAVLLTTGLHDARAPPWQPAKPAARLQAATASGRRRSIPACR
ncbi:hypothetical protein [Nonomuraea fuscirosea]|uniref:hypothetical protein n=1 Tax=Nonomuraea fuscirosea TaxID=1291556 RepID=UPI0015E6960B|nr:hypothetical protein [Nonomuraea fuscirosea]